MTALYLTFREVVKAQEIELGVCENLSKFSSMAERRESGGRMSEGAIRFRAVMKATAKEHENATAWAIRMGLGPTQVSNFRNGIPVSAIAADRIAGKTGVGSDYLRRGDPRFLTVEMRDRIQEAMNDPDVIGPDPEPSPGGSKRQDISP